MYNIYKRGFASQPLHPCPRLASGVFGSQRQSRSGPRLSLLPTVECELWPRLGVGGVPASPGLVKGQGRGPLGVPTPASPSKEAVGSRYSVGVLLLVEGMGEGDKNIQGPKPKCLCGDLGDRKREGKGCGRWGSRMQTVAQQQGGGMAAVLGFSSMCPYRPCDLRRQLSGLSVYISAKRIRG